MSEAGGSYRRSASSVSRQVGRSPNDLPRGKRAPARASLAASALQGSAITHEREIGQIGGDVSFTNPRADRPTPVNTLVVCSQAVRAVTVVSAPCRCLHERRS